MLHLLKNATEIQIFCCRDIFLYASSVDSRGLDETVEILGEVVLRPLFQPEQLQLW